MELYKIYNPITADPFKCTKNYMEFAPCDALKPYVRCFWGSREPVTQNENTATGLVTPDTCMDIIFKVDFTNNKIEDSFCGIDDRTFFSHHNNIEKKTDFTFAIHLHA